MSLLPEEERERYQGAYCGLCHAMGKRHGTLARFTLSYDFAFLAILFSGGESESWCPRKCPAHPLKKERSCLCGRGLDAAADASMILVWHKLRDDVKDSGFPRGVPARVIGALLRRSYQRAVAARPEFARQVEIELDRLRVLEEKRTTSIDHTADTFACVLKAAAPPEREAGKKRVLEHLLYHLGRWIYLVDAWDDLEEDRAHSRYNPLIARFGDEVEGEKEYISTTMTHSLKLAVSAANLAEFGDWEAVVNNMLYQGLPAVQEAVLNGRWKELRKKHREKHDERSVFRVGR